jgi:hypothetical protein
MVINSSTRYNHLPQDIIYNAIATTPALYCTGNKEPNAGAHLLPEADAQRTL